MAWPSMGGGASERVGAAHAGTSVAAAIANAADGGIDPRDDGGVDRDDGGGTEREGGGRDTASESIGREGAGASERREGRASGRDERMAELSGAGGATDGVTGLAGPPRDGGKREAALSKMRRASERSRAGAPLGLGAPRDGGTVGVRDDGGSGATRPPISSASRHDGGGGVRTVSGARDDGGGSDSAERTVSGHRDDAGDRNACGTLGGGRSDKKDLPGEGRTGVPAPSLGRRGRFRPPGPRTPVHGRSNGSGRPSRFSAPAFARQPAAFTHAFGAKTTASRQLWIFAVFARRH